MSENDVSIRPALTPEQADELISDFEYQVGVMEHSNDKEMADDARTAIRDALLRFSGLFTWEDVDALREEAKRGDEADRTGDNAGYSALYPPHARDLADRIAALLPPREQR